MTDLEKRFLKNTDDTGRFIYQSLVTGRKYYVEPIGGPLVFITIDRYYEIKGEKNGNR